MRIYDISLAISSHLPSWPGDQPPILEQVKKIEEGEQANVSRLIMSVHTGTHVDAPYHFLSNGISVETIPLDPLIGKADVIYLPEANLITEQVLREVKISPRSKRLLFKTKNSEFWAKQVNDFQTDFVGISPDGAEYLVKRGVKLVGVDYLSVAPYRAGRETHEILLKAEVVVLEGLDLSLVIPGRYTLCCLPLKLTGSDGSPARAILIGK